MPVHSVVQLEKQISLVLKIKTNKFRNTECKTAKYMINVTQVCVKFSADIILNNQNGNNSLCFQYISFQMEEKIKLLNVLFAAKDVVTSK